MGLEPGGSLPDVLGPNQAAPVEAARRVPPEQGHLRLLGQASNMPEQAGGDTGGNGGHGGGSGEYTLI